MTKTTSTVAWMGLVVAIIALIAIFFFPKSAPAQTNTQIQVMQQMQQEFALRMELFLTRVELVALRAELATDKNYEEVHPEISEIRGKLNRIFENAQGNLANQWRGVDEQFGILIQQLETNNPDAVDTLRKISNELEK